MPNEQNAARPFKFTTVVTEDCNLRCKYCYVRKQPQTMTREVIDALIVQAEKKINEGWHINMDMFGGEPLLAREPLKYLIEKTVELSTKYPGMIVGTIFTNATMLDREFLTYTHQFKDVIMYNFSLDGCRECHDAARVYADGSGSYDDTVRGMQLFADVYGYDVRWIGGKFVISPYNVKYLVKSAKAYFDEGRLRVSHSLARDDIWTEEDIVAYERELKELAQFYIDHIDDGVWYDLFAIPIIDYGYSKVSFCSAGKAQWGIAPNGDIYPCQRFFNNRSPFKFGNVFDGVDDSKGWAALFKNYSVQYNFIECSKCDTFPRFNCLGQCIASTYESGGLFRLIPSVCRLLKITYRVASEVYDTLKDNPNYQRTLDRNRYGG